MNDTKNNYSIELEIFNTLHKIIKTVDIYSIKLKERYNINSSQLSCLLALADAGPLSLSQLSKKIYLSPSMITGIVDQLENKKMVERIRDTKDRRVILIVLTKIGNQTVQKAPFSFQKKLIDSLAFLKKEEKNKINRSLSKLFSLIISNVLFESNILLAEDKLGGMEPSIMNSEENIKDKNIHIKKK